MEDRFLLALDRLEAGRRSLVASLTRLGKALSTFRRTRAHGAKVSDIISSSRWRDVHERVRSSISDFVSSLARARAVAVWTIAEEERVSLSEIARRAGNARQVISRLYHAGRDGAVTPERR